MSKLMEQVGQMQEQMQKAQDELANETVEATAVGGIVTVVANGAGRITDRLASSAASATPRVAVCDSL
jgi:nucleoid-associated protein EbfC